MRQKAPLCAARPQAFLDTLLALRGGRGAQALMARRRAGAAFGAAVAALGLSQKAVTEEDAAAAAGGAGGNAGARRGACVARMLTPHTPARQAGPAPVAPRTLTFNLNLQPSPSRAARSRPGRAAQARAAACRVASTTRGPTWRRALRRGCAGWGAGCERCGVGHVLGACRAWLPAPAVRMLCPGLGVLLTWSSRLPTWRCAALPAPLQVVTQPPLEEHLAQHSLWPETHKLYGHGNELHAAAASPDGALLASSCRAQVHMPERAHMRGARPGRAAPPWARAAAGLRSLPHGTARLGAWSDPGSLPDCPSVPPDGLHGRGVAVVHCHVAGAGPAARAQPHGHAAGMVAKRCAVTAWERGAQASVDESLNDDDE
jgi:hypothetical protein